MQYQIRLLEKQIGNSELKFNSSKTEFLAFNSKEKYINILGHSLTINGFVGPYPKRLQRTLQNALFSLNDSLKKEDYLTTKEKLTKIVRGISNYYFNTKIYSSNFNIYGA